jgi:hypothetical protein
VCNGSGSCTHPLAPVGTTCDSPSYGSWNTCGSFSDTCDETGTQSRSVTTYACTSTGACASSTSNESQACSRNRTGVACNTTYSNCGACTGFSDTCDESGTQSCTVTNYTCSAGACNPSSSGSGSQACSRDTDGSECSSSTSCGPCGGFSDYCDTSGTRSCTESTVYCSGGGCNSSTSSSYSEACSRSVNTACPATSYGAWSGCSNSCGASSESRTVTTYSFNCATGSCVASSYTETRSCPTFPCPSPSYGSWSGCGGFSDYCDTTGTQSRNVTAYICSSGTCSASSSTETQSCTRTAPGPQPCPSSYGSWSACDGFSDVCDTTGTQSRQVTDYSYNCSTGQCVATSSRTETQSCSRPDPAVVCRAAAGPCDVAEYCSGGSCPADGFVSGGTLCGSGGGQCDAPDYCTGSSASCPNNSQPNGSYCDDHIFCTKGDQCWSGACRSGPWEPGCVEP